MTAPDMTVALLLAALALDAFVGDPDWLWRRLPHPVVLFGKAIAAADRHLNRPNWPAFARRVAGTVAVAALLGLAVIVGALITALADGVPGGFILIAVVAATLLAHKSLIEHVQRVATALSVEGLAGGRRAVAMIVGRDPDLLDAGGVARSAIESAAENFSDGVVAPAFWFALFGLPGLFFYKMLNTADSMIGHRTARHTAFGWAAARLDDVANFIPARLSALIVLLAADPRRIVEWLPVVRTDAPKHRSVNAGWPEAAVAVAIDVALGGPRQYAGVGVIDGAKINAAGRFDATPADITAATRLLNRAALVQAGGYVLVLAVLLIA